jgi:hypothetical protein
MTSFSQELQPCVTTPPNANAMSQNPAWITGMKENRKAASQRMSHNDAAHHCHLLVNIPEISNESANDAFVNIFGVSIGRCLGPVFGTGRTFHMLREFPQLVT